MAKRMKKERMSLEELEKDLNKKIPYVGEHFQTFLEYCDVEEALKLTTPGYLGHYVLGRLKTDNSIRLAYRHHKELGWGVSCGTTVVAKRRGKFHPNRKDKSFQEENCSIYFYGHTSGNKKYGLREKESEAFLPLLEQLRNLTSDPKRPKSLFDKLEELRVDKEEDSD